MRMFKSVIIGFLVLVIPVCALQWGYYLKSRSAIVSREVSSMELVADMQQERMEAFVTYNLDRLDLVTSRRIFRELLREYLGSHDKNIRYQLDRSLSDARRAIPSFDVISVADLSGRIITSTDNALITTDVSATETFRRGSKENTITLEFPGTGQGDEAHILLSGPLVVDEKVAAVALLKVHPSELLQLLRGPENLAEGYWTLAQRVDPLRVALISPSANGVGLVRRIEPEDSEPHMSQALRGADLTLFEEGPSPHTYVTRFIASVGWSLILSGDDGYVGPVLADFRNSIFLLVLLLSAYVAGVSLYLGRIARQRESAPPRPHH